MESAQTDSSVACSAEVSNVDESMHEFYVRQSVVRVRSQEEGWEMVEVYKDYILPMTRAWDGYRSTSFLFNSATLEVIYSYSSSSCTCLTFVLKVQVNNVWESEELYDATMMHVTQDVSYTEGMQLISNLFEEAPQAPIELVLLADFKK